MDCKICNKSFGDVRSLGKHLHFSHPETTKEEYYNSYINDSSPICICGKNKKFRNLGEGYRTYCSVECRGKNTETTKYWLGKKQPKELVEKRIKNTNQMQKEIARKKTMLERYGVDNPSLVPDFMEKMKIKETPLPPRTNDHSRKIIESKRRNGTLNHSQETKNKIRKSVNDLYQSDNPPVTISENNNKNHKSGYHNGIYYRSSYELKFMEYCDNNNINYESAENKKFRIKYSANDKNHWYYPDFYLEDYDVVIEIKPDYILHDDKVLAKINAGKQNFRYFVLTEEELSSLDYFFEELNDEYFYSIN